MNNTKTIAFQIPEELFQRLKNHLAQEAERTSYKIRQRKFYCCPDRAGAERK